MAEVTIQVVQGLEAGTVLRRLPTPITIGREEENLVQLNDERISRFHAKIQSQGEHLILTDLESTNGTRVNGHYTRMRTVEIGDQIAVGRCLLVVGSPEEIAELGRVVELPSAEDDSLGDDETPRLAFPFGPPTVPQGLEPQHATHVATLIEYVRTEVLAVLNEIYDDPEQGVDHVQLKRMAWHRLQLLPPQLSNFLERLSTPADDEQ